MSFRAMDPPRRGPFIPPPTNDTTAPHDRQTLSQDARRNASLAGQFVPALKRNVTANGHSCGTPSSRSGEYSQNRSASIAAATNAGSAPSLADAPNLRNGREHLSIQPPADKQRHRRNPKVAFSTNAAAIIGRYRAGSRAMIRKAAARPLPPRQSRRNTRDG